MINPKKLPLANIPTPVQKINFEGCSFLIKRDDYTGLEFSGNKIRKLEYLIYQAKKEKSDYIFTCGGEQSNHSRATAVASVSVGIKPKLFLWGKDTINADGNLFIDKFVKSGLQFLSKKEYDVVNDIMLNEKKKLEKKGKKVYIIPEGGSSELGIWGYIDFINELKQQVNLKRIKGILSASGSGGTTAGLLIGAALNNIKCKIYAVNVLYSKSEIQDKIFEIAESAIQKYKLGCKLNKNQLEILDGYSSEGYKKITDNKISLIRRFAVSAGIILDPAYTGKAFTAYYEHFINHKNKSDVLFVHTGGFMGVFSKKNQYLKVK